MTCNITAVNGSDIIGCLGQGIAPIATDVTGFSGSEQILLGLLLLLLANGFLASRRATLEVVGVANFFLIAVLVQMGILPNIVLIAATLIAAFIVGLAVLKWRQK